MTGKTQTISVRILDKDYQVACPEDEIDALNASARLLDQQMRSIRDSGKVLGADRMAVMAALNLAHELVQSRGAEHYGEREVTKRLEAMHKRLDAALATHRQLSL